MRALEKPGAGGVAPVGNDPLQAYDAVNMEFFGDGTLRMRRGMAVVANMGGDIAHVNGWTENIVFAGVRYTIGDDPITEWGVKYGAFREGIGFTELGGDPSRLTSGSGVPWGWTSSVPFTRSHVDTGDEDDEDDYRTWMLFVSGTEQGGSPHSVFAVEPTGSPDFAAHEMDFDSHNLSVHGNYAIACGCIIAGSNYKGLRWTSANEPMDWPAERAVAAPPAEVGQPIAVVPWQQSISIIIGRAGMGEIQGDGSGFNFRASYAEMAAAAPNTVAKCGANIFFMAPGGRIVRVGEGGVITISDAIQKDILAMDSLRDLRAWHDSRGNYYCLSDTSSSGKHYVYIYSIARQRWEGKWLFFNDGNGNGVPTVGEARCEYANGISPVAPFAPTYIGCGPYLCRWLETAENDTDAFTQAEVWSRPAEDPRPGDLKQIDRVTVNGGGAWEVYLRYRDSETEPWQEELLGAVTAPDTVYGTLTTYRNRSIKCVTSDPEAMFRSIEIKEITRGGR